MKRVGIAGVLLAAVLGVRQSEIFYPVSVPYDRALYPHWSDTDGDCRDARQETLAAQSLVPVRWSADGCRVAAGLWLDRWSGSETQDPGTVDVDHMVPLGEAHRSGAHAWSPARREAFANDRADGQLMVLSARTNRSKADGDPLSWMPPRPSTWCRYVDGWLAVKRRWALDADLLERAWTAGLDAACRAGSRLRARLSAPS